jgi:phospholipid-binding lipoprotein MlaA
MSGPIRSVQTSFRRGGGAIVLALSVAACATVPDRTSDPEAYAEYQSRNDPIEPFNRGVYQVNRVLDVFFLKPAAGWYRLLTPPPVQTAISNFLRNLRSPVVLANDLLQGEFERAGNTSMRFAINSTIGVAGLSDPAANWFDIPRHDEDFGQTLAVWGVDEGPFLMLPVIGPSNPRDAAGLAVDNALLDPLGTFSLWLIDNETLTLLSRVRTGMTVIDARARNYEALEDIEKNTLDPYAALRSLYRQFRAKEISQGRAEGTPDLPGFEDDIPEIPDVPVMPDIPEADEPPGQ